MNERDNKGSDDKVTVVKSGGGSGGVIAGVVIGVAVIILAIFLFGGGWFGAGTGDDVDIIDEPDTTIEAPDLGGDGDEAAPADDTEPAADEPATDDAPATDEPADDAPAEE